MKTDKIFKFMFVLGAVIDGAIALSWLAIASGWEIPNILNGHIGAGRDYELAMYIAAMFMAGWSVLLAWGACAPVERKGLLLITAVFLALSVIAEYVFFGDILGGGIFTFGVTKRLVLSTLFTSAYVALPVPGGGLHDPGKKTMEL